MPPSSDGGILTRYEPVIGLEVHCQLKTASKLFCGCSTAFGALPNHHVCPVCLGLPGALPVLNSAAVDLAIKLALAVSAEVKTRSVFARKQYFYPDLPKGYQISQHEEPYCSGGGIRLSSGAFVPLRRIHLEEDAGKNVHEGLYSYIDLNRSGIPLVEIVSEPAIHTPENAADYLKRLRSLVRALEVSDGNLEEGSFRCDANVSLRRRGESGLGTRCEIKNLNSFKNIERAIRYEILRQADLLDNGQAVLQETLLFDPASGKTAPMRSKEESHDYRYFPDPDLGDLVIAPERVERIKAELPELPEAKAERYQTELGLTPYDAALLTSDKDLSHYFESVLAAGAGKVPPKAAANWLTTEFLREANEQEWRLDQCPIAADALAELLVLTQDGTISGKIAKKVFQEMVEKGGRPRTIVETRGLLQISDAKAIQRVIDEVLAESESQIQEYLGGKEKVFPYFVGQIMRRSGGRMNPTMVNDLLKQALEARRKA